MTMLLQLLPSELEQRCDICGAQRMLPWNTLRAGIELGDPPEAMTPDVIAMPPCADCRAQEFLNRVGSDEPGAAPGGVDDVAEHRRAVNALHSMLVAAGLTAPTLHEWFATETKLTERADVPWKFEGQPVAIVGRNPRSEDGFAAFLASKNGVD
jgi:hypothetical protein